MSTPPFFIVGFQRSGTTLLRLMLDSHPDIAIPLDTVGMWAGYADRLDSYGDLAREDNRRRLVEDVLGEERIRLWNIPLATTDVLARWKEPGIAGMMRAMHEAYAHAHGKRIWGDKDPGNMTRIDQLNAWFPDAKIIHIIRDGRDACLSHLTQDFGYSNVLECAIAWREEVQWVGRLGRILGESRYLELRYEDLIRESEQCLRRVCAFLGVPFSESMLRYHERVTAAVPDEKRHIWPLIGQPPVAANAGRWKSVMSSGTRVCFEKRAGGVLREHGYEVLPQASGAYVAEVKNLWTVAWRAFRHRIQQRPGSSRRRPE